MMTSLSYCFSNIWARKISITFLWTVMLFSWLTFLISCWVMVEPPNWESPPKNIFMQAFTVVIQSTPWCS